MTEATADITVNTEVVRRDEINGFVRGRLQVTSTATEAFAAAKDLFFGSRVGALEGEESENYPEKPLVDFFALLEKYEPLREKFNSAWDWQRDPEKWGEGRDPAVILSETIVQTATKVTMGLAMKEDYPEFDSIPQSEADVMVAQSRSLMKHLIQRWPEPNAK